MFSIFRHVFFLPHPTIRLSFSLSLHRKCPISSSPDNVLYSFRHKYIFIFPIFSNRSLSLSLSTQIHTHVPSLPPPSSVYLSLYLSLSPSTKFPLLPATTLPFLSPKQTLTLILHDKRSQTFRCPLNSASPPVFFFFLFITSCNQRSLGSFPSVVAFVGHRREGPWG